MNMEQNINLVTIPVGEYKSLVLDAERARLKEKDLVEKITIQKENEMRIKYTKQIDALREENWKLKGELQACRTELNHFRDLLKLPKPEKRHWWQ